MNRIRSSASLNGFTALAAAIAFTAFSPAPAAGQTPAQSNPDEFQISINVGMVMLPVVVTNHKGEEISGLAEDDFHVYEDGRLQRITFFEPEDVPVRVGLVIDNSGSMRSKRPEVAAAAGQFAKTSNPDDQLFVVNFNQRVSLGLPKGVAFTSNLQALLDAVSRNPASGDTALYDAVAAALDHLKADSTTTTRKALILITDGEDNASHMNLQALVKKAAASNTEIYSLGVFDENFSGSHSGSALKRLSKVTGGKAFFPQSPQEIVGICQQIAQDLRHEYTIGYVPTNPADSGKFHQIRVSVNGPRKNMALRASTRSGYVTSPAPQASVSQAPSKASL
jgi:VWFA-related protein